MSITNFPSGNGSASAGIPITKVTVPALAEMKRQGKPISALTAYDYASSRLADEAGIDLLLVGDSLAMVVLGHDNTMAVTVDEMLHHTRAVRRAVRRALVVADMPFGSYHGTVAEGLANAVRFLKEAGAEAVKIEGPRVELVRALTEAEIPVVGHLGLTPQSVHRMGGYRVQARTAEAAHKLKDDALALAEGRCRSRSAGGRAARSGCGDYGRTAGADHRHWRWAGVRRADSRLPRPAESYLCPGGQVCVALCRRRISDPRSD